MLRLSDRLAPLIFTGEQRSMGSSHRLIAGVLPDGESSAVRCNYVRLAAVHCRLRQSHSASMCLTISVFVKDPDGGIFHTYSCYARGLDMLNTAYHYLDLTPKGRDETGLPHSMAWVKYHDLYGT